MFSELTPEQAKRVFGKVTGFSSEAPYVTVEIDGNYPQKGPVGGAGLSYLTTVDGVELCALEDYLHVEQPGHVCLRIIDDDIRGWTEAQVSSALFGKDGQAVCYALIPLD